MTLSLKYKVTQTPKVEEWLTKVYNHAVEDVRSVKTNGEYFDEKAEQS
ncbi:MAG: hypothetical protein Q7N50_14350 [Armatimonadota bacterium]|nr:hypothetical protein [Armatimonadota bacterium]